jgi:hypothetical protein
MSALRTYLYDLHASGVTEVVSETAFNWQSATFQQAKPAKAAPQVKEAQAALTQSAPAPAAVVAQAVDAQPSQQNVRVQQGKLAELILPISDCAGGKLQLNPQVEALLAKMLQAIGLALAEVGISGVAQGKPTDLADVPVIIFGQDAAQAFFESTKSLNALRRTNKGMVTFHPQTLLAQPMLKKAAWGDLQAFQAKLVTA